MALSARLVVAALLIVATACGDGDADMTSPTTSPTSPTTNDTSPRDPSARTTVCSAPEVGYEVRFPADWHVNDPATGTPCRFFHPEPFDLPRNSEATGLAIVLDMANMPFDRIAPTGDTAAVEVVSRNEATVAGKRAVRVETIATGTGLAREGTRGVSYYVDFGDRTLVATTLESAAAGTFEDNTAVLDNMMATLTALDVRPPACSADRLPSMASPQTGLPDAVAQTRRSIVAAATACDYQALAQAALAGDMPFTYSFGERGEPADYWRQAEERGEPLLRTLVELLHVPFATRTVEGSTQFLWPSAFAYDRWAEIPPAEVEALRRVYSEEDLRRFEQFGSYAGHRVGITAEGDWIFFVAGD